MFRGRGVDGFRRVGRCRGVGGVFFVGDGGGRGE